MEPAGRQGIDQFLLGPVARGLAGRPEPGVDTKSLREGRLMAVVEECVDVVAGEQTYTRTAYVRGADGLEFTAAPSTLEQL
ncbi:hypothetical protein ACIQWR_23350 [Streptomyces sp. NPDC098789]|uniref:hypothetical protein n=1 Tax=Streptomyces sp. NPDC098789 TaxID=3366098 RepID=UPI00381CEF1B